MMARVLIAGHDWGGLNLLAPLMREWSASGAIVWDFVGAPEVQREMADRVPAYRRMLDETGRQRGAMLDDPLQLDSLFTTLLHEGRFDLVLCSTSAVARLERRAIAAARKAGIPSIAFCDMDWAYDQRFCEGGHWTVPDHLWVIDESMSRSASAFDWPERPTIDVVGSPLLADLLKERARRGDGRRIVRFISEPASTRFPLAKVDEFRDAEEVVRAVNMVLPGVAILVRPHPTEQLEPWRRWCYARRNLGVSIDTLPLEVALGETTFAVGISSTLLAEMRISGAAAASLQAHGADPNYYALSFSDLGIDQLRYGRELEDWLAQSRPLPTGDMELHARSIDRATDLLLGMLH